MTCQILSSLADLSGQYDAIFCDLWGCYHNGLEVYPAAAAACSQFRAAGGSVILLTNAPRPADSVQSLLDRMGAPRDSYDAIVSSGAACQAAVQSGRHGTRVCYVGPDRDLHMLTGIGLEPETLETADSILLTGLRDDRTETPEDYAEEMHAWKARGLTVLCANPDIIVDRGEMRLWCAGAIAKAYEKIGGEVIWYGKPHYPVYARCHEVLKTELGRDVPKERVLAIGDGILTDVPGGLAAGLDTLFVTGGLSSTDFGPDVEHPEQSALDRFLAEKNLAPQYAIGRLR